MSKVVYKYKVESPDDTRIDMPQGAEILCVQIQSDTPTIWALVDPNNPPQERVFEILGTGMSMQDNVKRSYIGTFQMGEGRLVFHVFEKINN